MTDVRHVDANLMRAAGVQRQLDQRGVLVLFEHTVFGERWPAAPRGGRHFLAVALAATDDRLDLTGGAGEPAPAHGPVNLLHASRFELCDQTMMRGVGIGDYDAATGAFV